MGGTGAQNERGDRRFRNDRSGQHDAARVADIPAQPKRMRAHTSGLRDTSPHPHMEAPHGHLLPAPKTWQRTHQYAHLSRAAW
jgi:hypothetical protein